MLPKQEKGFIILVCFSIILLFVLSGLTEARLGMDWDLYNMPHGQVISTRSLAEQNIVKRMTNGWVYVEINDEFFWVYDPEYTLPVPDVDISLIGIADTSLFYLHSRLDKYLEKYQHYVEESQALGIVVARANSPDMAEMEYLYGSESVIWIYVLEDETEYFRIGEVIEFYSYDEFNIIGLPDVGDLVVWYEEDFHCGWVTKREPYDRKWGAKVVDALLNIEQKGEVYTDLEYYREPHTTSAWYHYMDLSGLFAGGSGTIEEPYLISDAEHLQNVSHFPDSNFKQISDIDLYNQFGSGWNPICSRNKFKGTYDGSGFVIKNLKINSEQRNTGLFGSIEGGNLKNIKIEGASISGRNAVGILAGRVSNTKITNCSVNGHVQGYDYVGMLVGSAQGEGLISKVTTSGTAKGMSCVGGIVGSTGEKNIIELSMSDADVFGSQDDFLFGQIGGLVGYNSGKILNCYALGKVSGCKGVGGLVGLNDGKVTFSFAAGAPVQGDQWVGGLVGLNSLETEILVEGIVENSYYDIYKILHKDLREGYGIALDYASSGNAYSGWDFVNVWDLKGYGMLPKLKWMLPSENNKKKAEIENKPPGERIITIINQTEESVWSFKLALAGEENWQEMLDPYEDFRHGDKINLLFNRGEIYYDLKLIDYFGFEYLKTDVELFSDKEIIFTQRDNRMLW